MGRSRIALLGVTAVALLTTACSGGTPKATAPTTSPTPASPVQVTFAVYGPAPVVTAYTQIAADYTAAHPETVVNVQPYATHAAAAAALARAVAAGDPPDAFLADLTDLPALVAGRAVARLDELLGERHVDFGDGFQRGALEAFSADNALQCMPVDSSPLVVYYNADLLNPTVLTPAGSKPVTADTGWKLDTFTADADAVSNGPVRGLYIAPTLDQVAPFVWSAGGQIVDDQVAPTTLTLASSSSEPALEKLLTLVRDPSTTFTARQIAKKSALARFESGQLAMMFGYRDLTPVLRARRGLHFDVMPLPRINAKATSGQASGLCLSAASTHPEQTADFLAYVVSAEPMSLLANTGYVVPTNLDVVNSAAFLQPAQQPASARVFATAARGVQRFPAVVTWDAVAAAAEPLLSGLFDAPVNDPLDQRLKAIDAASVPLFTPLPPTPTTAPTGTPTAP